MAKEWSPSWVGQHVTGSSEWRLRLEGLELALSLEGRTHRVNVEDEASYRVNAGTFWTDITLHPGQSREVKADGLPNARGAALVQALSVALTEKRLRED
ncbi:UvrD-helicase domain-containing protein, partial [Xanthomonas citri pv. bilvae]